jgi:hypothetical protein
MTSLRLGTPVSFLRVMSLFFNLNPSEAQVSMTLCQKESDILEETGKIPIAKDINCLRTKRYKYGTRCALGCE